MTSLRPYAALVAGVLFALPEANAIDSEGNWIVRGIGSKYGSCGEYVSTNESAHRWFEHWLLGYVSGINRTHEGKADFTNEAAVAGMVQWMEKYCKENPLSSFSKAADALLEELQKRK